MAFTDLLTDALDKEKGGRHGGKGHDFQRYWALCHLLQLDQERDDYLLLVEYVEDVAILDSESNPSHIDLIQLKKKTGTSGWTKAGLVNPPKEGGLSVLGKLFASHKQFDSGVATVAFGSNVPISLELASGKESENLSEFDADSLTDDLKLEIQNSLATQLKCEPKDLSLTSLRFVKSDLALDDLATHVSGKVGNYLKTKFPDHRCRPDILCQSLFCELSKRAGNTQDAPSFDELKRARGIGASDLKAMLTPVLHSKAPADIVETIFTSLGGEGVSWTDRDKFKASSRRYLIDRTAKSNSSLDSIEREVETLKPLVPPTLSRSWDVAHWMYDQMLLTTRTSNTVSTFEKHYVIAVILYAMNQ
jgi:hypothetical protein